MDDDQRGRLKDVILSGVPAIGLVIGEKRARDVGAQTVRSASLSGGPLEGGIHGIAAGVVGNE
jgi:hypothetical protein